MISKGIFVKELATFEEVNITCSTNVKTDLTLSCFNKTVSGVTTSLTIAHNFTKEDNGEICYCTSVYNCYEKKQIQKPVYLAYGPSKLNISSEDLKLDLCTDGTVAFSVPENEVYPAPYFNISTNDPNSLVRKIDTSDYNGTVAVQAQKDGEFNLTIEAFNAYDANIRTENVIKVIVSDSHLKKPVLIINKGQIVQEGKTSQNVSITCKSSDYDVSLIHLSCLGTNVSSNGTDVVIYANLTRFNNSETCSCQVQYNSTCGYVGQSSVPINVTYEATIYNFTANHLTTTEVSEGDNVTLKCYVDSNPKPFISVQSESGHHFLPINYFNSNVTLIHPNIWETQVKIQDIKCRQSSVYYCIARNQLFTDQINRTVTIYVRCGVHFLSPSNIVTEIKGKLNGVGAAYVEFIGYPEPKSIILFRRSQNESIDNRFYTYTYIRNSVQYGTLKIFFDQLKEENFTTYVVNVSNGHGPDLSFQFSIVKETEPLTLTEIIIICTVTASMICILIITVVLVVRYLKKRKKKESTDPDQTTLKTVQPTTDTNRQTSPELSQHLRQGITGQGENYDEIDENNALENSETRSSNTSKQRAEKNTANVGKSKEIEKRGKSGHNTSKHELKYISLLADDQNKIYKNMQFASHQDNCVTRVNDIKQYTLEGDGVIQEKLETEPFIPKGEQEQENYMDTIEYNDINSATGAPKMAGAFSNTYYSASTKDVEVIVHTESNQSNVPIDNDDDTMNVMNPSKKSYVKESKDETIPKSVEPTTDKNRPLNRYTPMTVDQNQVSISQNTI